LLSLRTTAKQTLLLGFSNENTLVVRYAKGSDTSAFQSGFGFEPDTWYRLAVTFNKNGCIIFANSRQLTNHKMRTPSRFSQTVSRAVIGNSVDRDTPLKFNLSCAYLFGVPFTADALAHMTTLPIDFIQAFSPSALALYPELKLRCAPLFTEAVENKQLCCYNARMTVGTSAVNLARHSIGNATVDAEIVPFSSSFCDIIANIGGLRNFLPLFKQVDFPVTDGSPSDSTPFLRQLVALLWNFCRSRVEIEDDFFRCDGMKCLAYLLTIAKSSTLAPPIMSQLADFYAELKNPYHKLAMLEDIWLKFPLWHTGPRFV
jgi:hypothetical protein